jgi:hypothetical protein
MIQIGRFGFAHNDSSVTESQVAIAANSSEFGLLQRRDVFDFGLIEAGVLRTVDV